MKAVAVVEDFDTLPDRPTKMPLPADASVDDPPLSTSSPGLSPVPLAPEGDNNAPPDSDKEDAKKRKIPPIVFVPLLGAFLVITIVPSVVSNVINKAPSPSPPAPAPAPGPGSSTTGGFGGGGDGGGISTPSPAPSAYVAPTTTPAAAYTISTAVANVPTVTDIAYDAAAQVWVALNTTHAYVWAPSSFASISNAGGGTRLAFDSAGSLYIADTQQVVQHAIVGGGTNWVSAPATTTTSTISSTTCMASVGTTAVALGTASGALTTWNTSLAGGPTAVTYASPASGLPAVTMSDVAVQGTTVYIADAAAHCIRRLVLQPSNLLTGTLDVLAGACGTAGYVDGATGASRWNGPSGIAVDGYGIVYVSDTANNVVRKIEAGVVSTLVGNTTAGLADGRAKAATMLRAPARLAVNAAVAWKTTSGTLALHVVDAGNQCIRKITYG
ncbi:Aste57867_13430 [Aphanomyces stellatus]|uniref:Aste57867_13430 protein n=1 Tax=Aphanomyces stellatus TaxID=120398 RepID=A0A485KY45_9STRA|nr:hypothetical protein As57867_013380 [Aphanomyces stellatus]VFT90269.1 Aste57867_13430 [Aphanomyces stellatus]